VKNVSGPKFILPAIDGSTVKQKLFLDGAAGDRRGVAVYGVARTVDIATLTMIYIILGLGLNVVVGFPACWCWATAGSTPSAPTPSRC
jgi:branched-chain amino acid transport system permease protein